MSSKMFELAKTLQELAHLYGYEDFRDAITQACFNASEDTGHLDDRRLTQRYRYLATSVADAAINEPEFSHAETED